MMVGAAMVARVGRGRLSAPGLALMVHACLGEPPGKGAVARWPLGVGRRGEVVPSPLGLGGKGGVVRSSLRVASDEETGSGSCIHTQQPFAICSGFWQHLQTKNHDDQHCCRFRLIAQQSNILCRHACNHSTEHAQVWQHVHAT